MNTIFEQYSRADIILYPEIVNDYHLATEIFFAFFSFFLDFRAQRIIGMQNYIMFYNRTVSGCLKVARRCCLDCRGIIFSN